MLLPASFYERHALHVARDLLGMRLVRLLDGGRVSGVIVETEAYQGEEDLACHARAGRTPRTEVMYGEPGSAYIYFTYGMHWLLNCVCMQAGYPAAVLLRAMQPLEGIEQIAARRSGRPASEWCNGPAKLTRAMAIDGRLNGINLCEPGAGLYIEEGTPVADEWVQTSPRIGIQSVPEPWRSLPWRFTVHS